MRVVLLVVVLLAAILVGVDCSERDGGSVLATKNSVAASGGGVFSGYSAQSVQQTAWGYTATLNLQDGVSGPYGNDIQQLQVDVYFQTNYRVHVKIFDPNDQRWEVPGVVQTPEVDQAAEDLWYSFSYTLSPFGFAITRTSDNEVLFNTTSPNTGDSSPANFNNLIFENQYLEISTQLPQQPNIYGLGERQYQFHLTTNTTYTIFNRDQGTPLLYNLYGSHAVYLEMRNGLAHGVFLLNSNPMDVLLNTGALTYKTIGGVLDFYIFLGPTPNDVVQQYTEVIGRPYLPPYWGLGWHQCRWGYHTLNESKEMVLKYEEYQIPLDTAWNDIDYMDNYKDFTFDPVRFPPSEMGQYVDWLHSRGQQYIVITDPGISNTVGYAPYDQGVQMGVFIQDFNGEPLLGQVWPGSTVFPDFINQSVASVYWFDQISQFHSVAQFDGLWIDMNEISSFCSGACNASFDPNDIYDMPPYKPWNSGAPLNTSTVSLRAITNGTVMYNTHNLYGYMEGIATMAALQKVRGERTIVISRSSYPGHGVHASHWLGDNWSDWPDLYYSIPGILNFQLFGIPLVGADICGFNGNTTEELCTRWMQLGSFYPFARNHNSIGSRSQEPYAFGPLLLEVSRKVLLQRYSLLPYWYTQFWNAHSNGSAVVRPVFFEFPSDPNTLTIDYEFLVGRALLVTPVLQQGATSVVSYFPDDGNGWYDPETGMLRPTPSGGGNVTLDAPIDVIPWSIRGGNIIPIQQPETTTAATRKNPFTLLVALSQSQQYANGTLYLDDGLSLDTDTTLDYTIAYYEATQSSDSSSGTGVGNFTAQFLINNWEGAGSVVLNQIEVFGAQGSDAVFVNGQIWGSFNYNSETQLLTVYSLDIPMNQAFSFSWTWDDLYSS